MKRNTIVRIVIFSITIVILLGILAAGIAYDALSANLYSGRGDLEVEQAGPLVSEDDVTMGSVNAERISELEIDWAAGSITIQPDEHTDTIRFYEDRVSNEKYGMYYTTSGSKLTIRFCEETDWDSAFGITINSSISKDLTILVPADWVCGSLEIDAAAATVEIHDLTIREVEMDTASGACGFENCHVDTLDIDTASGDVIFSGSLNALDCDGASASIALVLDNIPDRIDVDTASGNLSITLPENAGFTASVEGLSTKLNSDFDCEIINGRYICGNGSCRIDVSAMSGNVYIRKNPNLTSADVTTP